MLTEDNLWSGLSEITLFSNNRGKICHNRFNTVTGGPILQETSTGLIWLSPSWQAEPGCVAWPFMRLHAALEPMFWQHLPAHAWSPQPRGRSFSSAGSCLFTRLRRLTCWGPGAGKNSFLHTIGLLILLFGVGQPASCQFRLHVVVGDERAMTLPLWIFPIWPNDMFSSNTATLIFALFFRLKKYFVA